MHRIVSTTVIAAGLALMAFKIIEDSEPGLIPLLLVVGGLAWKGVMRLRMRRRQR